MKYCKNNNSCFRSKYNNCLRDLKAYKNELQFKFTPTNILFQKKNNYYIQQKNNLILILNKIFKFNDYSKKLDIEPINLPKDIKYINSIFYNVDTKIYYIYELKAFFYNKYYKPSNYISFLYLQYKNQLKYLYANGYNNEYLEDKYYDFSIIPKINFGIKYNNYWKKIYRNFANYYLIENLNQDLCNRNY